MSNRHKQARNTITVGTGTVYKLASDVTGAPAVGNRTGDFFYVCLPLTSSMCSRSQIFIEKDIGVPKCVLNVEGRLIGTYFTTLLELDLIFVVLQITSMYTQ